MVINFVLLVLFLVVENVKSHSWASCVKCTGAGSCVGNCQGYARNWFTQPSNPFSQDQGWDRRPGQDVPGGLFCDNTKQRAHANPADGYTAQYPMATYSPGEQVKIQWPAKNHADVGTQRGVQLFFGRGPGLGDDFSHITSKASWLQQYPGLTTTFSNCNPPGPGVDGAECLGTFTVPSDLQEGIYSVIWWWEFNGGEFYSSCYDVQVTSGGGSAPPGTGNANDECLPSNLPAGTCPITSVEPVGTDGLAFVNAPSQIPSNSGTSFTVDIKYSASESQKVVLDILDSSGAFYGGGLGNAVDVSAGEGKISMTVTIATTIATSNTGVYLKVWNVRSSQWSSDPADEPWKNEITRLDQSVAVGDSLVQCTPIPDNCIESLLGLSFVEENGGALAGILIAIIIFLIALYFLSSTQDGMSRGILDVVKEPTLSHILFRFFQWFLALLTFSLWSSSENSDCCSGGNFLLAMGVLVWLYTMLLLFIMIMMFISCDSVTSVGIFDSISQSLLSSFLSPLIDLVFGLLCVFAVCAAAFRHPNTNNARGAVACIFFLSLSLLVTSVLHFMRKCLGARDDVSSKGREKVQSNADSSGSYNAPDDISSMGGDQC